MYSISYEPGFEHLIHGFIFELNETGELTLKHQRVTPGSLPNFPKFNTPQNLEILNLIEEFSPNQITKRFSKKEIKPTAFLKKFLTKENTDQLLRPYLEMRISTILDKLRGTTIYLRERDHPAQFPLKIEHFPATVSFNFKRNEEGTVYTPKILHNRTYVNLASTQCILLSSEGAWLVAGKTIYHFQQEIEGKKLAPFFSKRQIKIPKASEKTYYQKFVRSTAESFPTRFKGLHIRKASKPPTFMGFISSKSPDKIVLKVKYEKTLIDIDSKKLKVIEVENKGVDFEIVELERDFAREQQTKDLLNDVNLVYKKNSRFETIGGQNVIQLVNENFELLAQNHITIELTDFDKDYFLGKPSIEIGLNEKIDWFDIKAVIRFGEFEIPFFKIKKNILNNDPEFKLPNGQIGLIPQEWFAQFRYVFAFAEKGQEGIILNKQHYALVSDEMNQLQKPDITNKKHALRLDHKLEKILRPYQKEGFEWLAQLSANNLAGVLADDMGLGKTLQTISLLDAVYSDEVVDSNEEQTDLFTFSNTDVEPTLIVVPSSLVHNWASEIRRFSKRLTFHIHSGQNRSQDPLLFKRHHIIITTYGLLRNDFDFLSSINYRYLILDESQVIKNPVSKIATVVNKIKSNHRLALTGTPIENSLSDLWSQMNFLNEGLLGSYSFFKSEFVSPIEKHHDEAKKEKLKKLVFPFVLRRTKEGVAKELPPLTEQTLTCEMVGEQQKLYDSIKSKYRNYIFNELDDPTGNKNRFVVLKGLTELRLIANHPKIYDAESDIESGKFQMVKERLQGVLEAKHNVLIFSQFTRQIAILQDHLKAEGITYALLTGATSNRQDAIKQFTDNPKCQVFLISLKAGGIGLNLTKADYVFLLDPWWNPFAEKQAIDRAYRIGQKNSVMSYRFITKNSIEEKIVTLQNRKRQLAGEFIPVGSKSGFEFDSTDLEELFS